jgi:Flp pilus assembly protein TadG
MAIFGKKMSVFKRGIAGTALIEFALVAPILLLVLTAGYQAFQYV